MATSFSFVVLIAVRMLVMCVANNMRGWCQELMKTLGGLNCTCCDLKLLVEWVILLHIIEVEGETMGC